MNEPAEFDFKNLLNAILVCTLIFVTWAWWQSKRQPPPAPIPSEPDAPYVTPPHQSDSPAASGTDRKATASSDAWRVLPVAASPEPIIVGSRDALGGFKAELTFNPNTAGLEQVLLSGHKFLVDDEETGYPLLTAHLDQKNQPHHSFQCRSLTIAGQPKKFDLTGACWRFDGIEAEGDRRTLTFTATIVDAQDTPQVEVIKTYSYARDDYEMDLSVELVNLTVQPLQMTLTQYGPGGVRREDPRSDRRQTIVCYTDNAGQPTIKKIQIARKKKSETVFVQEAPKAHSLLWYALEDKFFVSAVRPRKDVTGNLGRIKDGTVETLAYPIPRAVQKADPALIGNDRYLITRKALTSPDPVDVDQRLGFHFKVYLGPIDTDMFKTEEPYASLFYENLLNTISCAFCTFQWLTTGLLKIMDLIFAMVGNYGIAIIALVLIVRLLLHPITKKGQVQMMQMSKMASQMQPKMEEIKKKYAGNNMEIQRQMAQLYKEQGMNPAAGCLGILPMLIQMPIWVALFTAVDANIHIRHQGLLPASWHWITDLSAPDRLIPFSWFGLTEAINIPLLSKMIGGIDAFNLLPILLCVAMYLQMKYTAQPTAVASNPQLAQQQKIMKVMMPVMMLLFFYTAPSGLNLYIMGSTFGGLIEQHFIRKHIKEEEQKEAAATVKTPSKISAKLGPKKKKPKPPIRYS